MKKKVLNTIKKYNLIEKGDKIICAVSGGPDSICMLDILNKIKKELEFDIVVCHVNHLIREEADEDEKYVENYCKKNNIEIYIKRTDVKSVANNKKQGLEEAGRNIRYEFFEEIFDKIHAQKIAIAHNKNDKIETIIMNFLRGSGVPGLKGIEPIRQNKFIRPLIEIERDEIENYCTESNLNPRIDKTNYINDCTRNKIRNIVLPYVKEEFNSNIVNTIDRLSSVISLEDEYISNQTRKIYEKIKIKEENERIILNLKEFNMQEKAIKTRLILYTIERVIGTTQNVEKINIDDVIKLCEKNVGNKYIKPNKNIKILVNKGKIFFENTKVLQKDIAKIKTL